MGDAKGGALAWLSPLWMLSQVTEISNVKCVTRLPKETKRQAVAIIFTDDSARTFTCDSGEALGLQTSIQPPWASRVPVVQSGGRAWLALAGMMGEGGVAFEGAGPQNEVGQAGRIHWPCPPCLVQWGSSG